MAENINDVDKRKKILEAIWYDLEDNFNVPPIDNLRIFDPTFYNETNSRKLENKFMEELDKFEDEIITINQLQETPMSGEQHNLEPFIDKLKKVLNERLAQLKPMQKDTSPKKDASLPKPEAETDEVNKAVQVNHSKAKHGKENRHPQPQHAPQHSKSDPGPAMKGPKKKM